MATHFTISIAKSHSFGFVWGFENMKYSFRSDSSFWVGEVSESQLIMASHPLGSMASGESSEEEADVHAPLKPANALLEPRGY